MTFVGKILVIVIMVFALLFLAFSTVVFTTEKNWKDEAAKYQKQVTEIQGDLQQVKGQLQIAENNLDAEKKQTEALTKEMQGRIDALQNDISIRQQEITKQRTAVETALQNARNAQAEAQAHFEETTKLRDQFRAVQKQANDFKLQQTELDEKIRLLERELEVAKTNNKQLRENVVVLSKVIQANGLDPDPARWRTLELAPDVDGQITRVEPGNRRFQISIGEDDGIVPGVEMFVYRFAPRPEYLGQVRVISVDSDRAVVTVMGSTPQGKRIQEGDIVSTKIRPRG